MADVIEKGVSTFAHDASTDERFSEGQSVIAQHVRSVMCVPHSHTRAQFMPVSWKRSKYSGGRGSR